MDLSEMASRWPERVSAGASVAGSGTAPVCVLLRGLGRDARHWGDFPARLSRAWSGEVENLLYEHPAVHEACIIGVPDARSGEAVMALLALKPGAQLHESELIAWCRERMAAYKVPRHVRFLDQLPKSTTGKIAWRALQEAERRALTEGAPA